MRDSTTYNTEAQARRIAHEIAQDLTRQHAEDIFDCESADEIISRCTAFVREGAFLYESRVSPEFGGLYLLFLRASLTALLQQPAHPNAPTRTSRT
jgi:hypothetical protein